MTDLLDRVAGAPITWGVCEVPAWGHRMEPERVLSEMASIGMRATELGPVGFLPTDSSALQAVLRPHGLRLVGGFIPIVLHRPDRWAEERAVLETAVVSMAEAGADAAVLAASGSDDSYETSEELGDDEWRHLGAALGEAAEVCSRHGLTASLHPHLGTLVESPEQIERAMAESTVPLCLDTGHVLAGGGDPVKVALEHRDRIAHVHLKDVDAALAARVRRGESSYHHAVTEGLYRPLGKGDVDLTTVITALEDAGYDGWYVLEQDAVLTTEPEPGSGPVADASAGMRWLEDNFSKVSPGPTGRDEGPADPCEAEGRTM
jgi:inosose dehydratase